jgi:hypothetical protein
MQTGFFLKNVFTDGGNNSSHFDGIISAPCALINPVRRPMDVASPGNRIRQVPNEFLQDPVAMVWHPFLELCLDSHDIRFLFDPSDFVFF